LAAADKFAGTAISAQAACLTTIGGRQPKVHYSDDYLEKYIDNMIGAAAPPVPREMHSTLHENILREVNKIIFRTWDGYALYTFYGQTQVPVETQRPQFLLEGLDKNRKVITYAYLDQHGNVIYDSLNEIQAVRHSWDGEGS
jgi:hypothetical protein